MEPTLIACAALAVLVVAGVVLLERRLARLQEGLERLDELEGLSRRVHALAGELDRKQLNAPLAAKMTEFTEADRRLSAGVAELQQELRELRRAVEAGRPGADAAGPGPADVAALVRQHLQGAGFERVQLLSDLTRLDGLSGRVVFEAHRHDVLHKGHVTLRDGAVVDENVRAAYSAFP